MPALVEMTGFPLAATRDAIKRAEARGLVSVLPKRGVVVMSAEPELTRDCLDLRAILDQEGARRLIESGLESAAGRSARRPRARARRPRAARSRRTCRSWAMATDLSLHDALSTGLANPLAAAAYAVNRDKIAVIQNTRPFLADRVISAMEEHLAIIDALERRDADAAVEAIAHHYRTTLRWWGVEP